MERCKTKLKLIKKDLKQNWNLSQSLKSNFIKTRMIWSLTLFSCWQLDDWVLCRVRQKTSGTRSTWEDSHTRSYEPRGYFQLINENPNQQASRSTLPSIDMASSIRIKYRDNGKVHSSFHEDQSTITGAEFLASTAESLFNSLKRKSIEENQLDLYYALPCKKRRDDDDNKERVGIDISKGYDFDNFDQWTSIIIQPQELNNLAFAKFIWVI